MPVNSKSVWFPEKPSIASICAAVQEFADSYELSTLAVYHADERVQESLVVMFNARLKAEGMRFLRFKDARRAKGIVFVAEQWTHFAKLDPKFEGVYGKGKKFCWLSCDLSGIGFITKGKANGKTV